MILVNLGVHRIDLPLTEGVIQRVVDRRRCDPESRGSYPINVQEYGKAPRLLIRRDTLQFRQILQAVHEAIGPVIQLIRIWVFERVLELCATDPVIYRDVLHGSHKQMNSLNFLQFQIESPDHVGRADIAYFERLRESETDPK